MIAFAVAMLGIGCVFALLVAVLLRFHADEPRDPSEIICPVCGYYCAGDGGAGCIDKPAIVRNQHEQT